MNAGRREGTLRVAAAVATMVVAVALVILGRPRATLAEARAELRGYLEDIPGADLARYDLHDSLGQPMEPGAIVPAPDGLGFAAVYFVYVPAGNTFDVHLATSLNLVDWTWRVRLAESASQPTIEPASDGGWVVAWEKEPPNHLQFAWYATWPDLLEARPTRFFDVPMTLSTCAEGTPNLNEASSTYLDVGFHYFDDCEVDRPAHGTTDWQTWTAAPRRDVEAAVRTLGVAGGVGDRDVVRFRGHTFTLQEGMAVPGRWETFRIYLYDDESGVAERLDIHTGAGCVAFTNPMVELLEIGGRQAIVATLFVPGEAGVNCEVGGMLYARQVAGGGG